MRYIITDVIVQSSAKTPAASNLSFASRGAGLGSWNPAIQKDFYQQHLGIYLDSTRIGSDWFMFFKRIETWFLQISPCLFGFLFGNSTFWHLHVLHANETILEMIENSWVPRLDHIKTSNGGSSTFDP